MINKELLFRLNSINMEILFSGRATVGSEWHGTIVDPLYSRLYYVADGEGIVRFSNGEIILTSGFWYLLPAGVSFEYECLGSLDHVFFHIKLCGANGIDMLSSVNKPLRFTGKSELLDMIFSIDFVSCTRLLALKCELCAMICNAVAKKGVEISEKRFSKIVEDSMEYIRENLSSSLEVQKIADALFLSKSSLEKHFRKELGFSVGKFIDSEVLDAARGFVAEGKLSMKEISDRLGFSDQFYFSKKFKAKYGVTPREYRKRPIA